MELGSSGVCGVAGFGGILRRVTRPMALVALTVSAVVAAGIALGGCGERDSGHGGTLAAIRARGEITWGGDVQGGEPYVYEDPNHPGQITGFEVDLERGYSQGWQTDLRPGRRSESQCASHRL